MTLKQALQQQLSTVTDTNEDWIAFEMNGLSYKTEAVLSNQHNTARLERPAIIETVGDEFIKEQIIRCGENVLLPVNIDGMWELYGNGGGAFRKNGLLQ